MKVLPVGILLLSATVSSATLAVELTDGYGPDPDGVPADFLCEWRKVAFNYSTQLRPDSGAMVYDALQLDAYCTGQSAIPRPNEASLPQVFPPKTTHVAGAVVVDGQHGDDSNPGTVAQPLKTVAAGVAKARGTAAKTVELRAGTYYLGGAVSLTEDDSGLTIQNYVGEEVWLSGAAPISNLQWEVVLPGRNASMEDVHPNLNNANGCGKNHAPAPMGSPNCGCDIEPDAASCAGRCEAASNCTSYTYHDSSLGKPWGSYCCQRTDGVWNPVEQTGHSAARKFPAMNGIYKASTNNALSKDAIVTELRVAGERRGAARFPNANPETEFWPVGYLTSREDFEPKGDWKEPTIKPSPNPATLVDVEGRPWDDYFSRYGGGINGTCSIYDPPFSFWCQSTFSEGCGGCFTWNIPSGMQYTPSALPRAPNYTNVEDAQFFAWRKAHWANWMFDVAGIDLSTHTIEFGRGGFQGARGGPGSDWFIANVLEELDDPREFYFDRANDLLYVMSNTTGPPADDLYEGLQQHTLIQAQGSSMAKPIRGLTIRGIGFRDVAPTYMQPHGVPSGGDWALERFGALFFQNTEGLTIDACKVWRASGNGVMLSAYNQNATVSNSEFAWMGGSAIAAWGYTDEISDGGIHGIDGTGGDFPRYTQVRGNLFHEIGVWEKQSSAFFQAKTAQTEVSGNVVFNLGRAGFNFNDGFGGGDVIHKNILFNTCRESSDHGPINSWDRQPFLTTVRNGTASTLMEWREVYHNFIVANYGGSKEVDNDDGSLFWRIHDNTMLYGWSQKFKCGGIESWNNLKAFVDTGGKFDAGCTTHGGSGDPTYAPNLWHNDTMIHLETNNFAYRDDWGKRPSGVEWDTTQVYNNTIYLNGSGINAMVASETLAQVQKRGGDPGTQQINHIPTTADIVGSIKAMLDPYLRGDKI
eukprot:INCI9923.3.p1 GENE.INCI9923.3~~INCI9923.3.p1  ORF type:complete len:923 (-),score=130.23 INCI9923.3:2785-5553(-)